MLITLLALGLLLALPRTAKEAGIEQPIQTAELTGPVLTDEMKAEIEKRAIEEDIALKKLIDTAKAKSGKWGGQCVVFIQRLFNSYYTTPAFRGYAGRIKPNATEPEVGGVVLTHEGKTSHVALIIEKTDTDIAVCDSNFSKHGDERVRCGRRMKLDDKRITGYFNFEPQGN